LLERDAIFFEHLGEKCPHLLVAKCLHAVQFLGLPDWTKDNQNYQDDYIHQLSEL
jgi:hypothetical protein